MSRVVFIQTDHLQKARVAPLLCRVIPTCEQTGFTPMVSAASLADAQAEIARLRGALERCRTALDSCTPGDYSTGHVIHPYFDEDAINAAQDLLDGLGI